MRKLLTEADGRALALKMLVEIEDDYRDEEGGNPWPLSIEAMYRAEGTQQLNIVLRYLDSIRDCREAMTGFCSVLTDHLFISILDNGSSPWRGYADLTERDITGSPGPWPSMDDDEEDDAAFQSFMQHALDKPRHDRK